MDSNTAIKVLLRGTHLHGNTETLQHLSNSQAENMQTHHLLFRSSDHKFKLGGVLLFLLGGEDIVVHRCEAGVIDLDIGIAEALAGFGLGETDSADFGVGEDNSRDVLVREMSVLEFSAAEEAAAELTAGSNCDCYCRLLKKVFYSCKVGESGGRHTRR